MLISRGNSKATVGVAWLMFLLSVREGHKGKREITPCHGDTKLMVPPKSTLTREHSLEGNWVQRAPR